MKLDHIPVRLGEESVLRWHEEILGLYRGAQGDGTLEGRDGGNAIPGGRHQTAPLRMPPIGELGRVEEARLFEGPAGQAQRFEYPARLLRQAAQGAQGMGGAARIAYSLGHREGLRCTPYPRLPQKKWVGRGICRPQKIPYFETFLGYRIRFG